MLQKHFKCTRVATYASRIGISDIAKCHFNICVVNFHIVDKTPPQKVLSCESDFCLLIT